MSIKLPSRPESVLIIDNNHIPQLIRTTTSTNDNATLNSSISCSLTQGSSDKRRNEDISDSTAIDDTKRRKRLNSTESSRMQEQNSPRVEKKSAT